MTDQSSEIPQELPHPVANVALHWSIRVSTAVFGFSVAIALAPWLRLPARPTDMLSALKLSGYSPTGSVLQFAAVVLLSALFAIVGDRVARELAAFRWAGISYCAALLLAPVTLIHFGNMRHVVLHGLLAAVIYAVRRRDPRFTVADVILIPVTLSCYLAFLDAGFGKTPVATSLRAMMVVFAVRLIVTASDAWTVSPLALLVQIGWLVDGVSAAIALIILFGTPFLLSRVKWRIPRSVVYPIVVFAYPLAVLGTPPPTTANFFEDSHNVPVAVEMLRGEKPYTDIVPMHGLISDGVLDFVAMKLGVTTLRGIMAVRLIAGATSAIALYCIALAATGSIEMGLAAAFLAFALFPGSTLWLRPAVALFALAATVAATRLDSRRWFRAAGALVVIAYLVSVDFGVYSALVALFAAARSRALRDLALGIAAAAVPCLLIFAGFGFAKDFILVNVREIFGGNSAGFLPLQIPECLRTPDLLRHLANCIDPLVWLLALFGSCAAFARSPFRAKRSDALWIIGIWIVVAAAGYVRRWNYHFNPAVTPFLVAGLWTLARHARTLATVLTVAVVLLAQPFAHIITVVPQLRETRAPQPLFEPTTFASIDAAKRFAATLRPDETFVDFSNSALLYTFLNRDCPLRHVTVASYQSEEAEREVIRSIEQNRHIRAALISFPGSFQDVDGITNDRRAPLVWTYLQKHFTPAFDEDGVVFWKRVR